MSIGSNGQGISFTTLDEGNVIIDFAEAAERRDAFGGLGQDGSNQGGDAKEPRSEGELKFRFVRACDLEPRLTHRGLVKGIFDHGAMAVIYGESGSGKTFLALDIAAHIAEGKWWFGRRVKQGAVAYVACEAAGSLNNRLWSCRTARMEGAECRDLYTLQQGIDLLNGDDPAELIRSIQQIDGCVLVVIDTLSQAMPGGEENGSRDMTAFVRVVNQIRETVQAAILIVHHAGKVAAKGARGHSSLRAATDTEIEVSGTSGPRLIRTTKQRDMEFAEEMAFELQSIIVGTDEDGDDLTSCIVAQTDELPESSAAGLRGLKGQAAVLMSCAEYLIKDKSEAVAVPAEVQSGAPPRVKPGHLALPGDSLKRRYLDVRCEDPDKVGQKTDSHTRAYKRALQSLIDARLATTYKGFVWIFNKPFTE